MEHSPHITDTAPSDALKAIIIGGGVAGLTAALAFHHFGWRAEVLEQANALSEVGAGIQISPNGMKVLRALGLEAAIREKAFQPEALEMRLGRSGQQIFRIDMSGAEQRWGAPYLHLHRADLIEILATAVKERLPATIRLSTRIRGYEQAENESAKVHLADGRTVRGHVIVGADGIHSAIRAQMIGPDQPDFTGNLAWRFIVPIEALGDDIPPPTACVWAGAGKHAVTYRLRQGHLANFVGVVERKDWQSEAWTEKGTREEALADFADWHPILTRLIEKAETHYRWALFDRKPLPRWSEGQVVLIGDACHPTLPFMAQGAVMAIEDAFHLARLCATDPDQIPAALQRFYKDRIKRTSAVQSGSRANMKTFHKRRPLARLSTYGPMWLAGQLAPGFVRSRQDWLYEHDVTAL